MAKQYGFYVNTDRCVQCHACEVACKSWNGIELGVKWRKVLDVWSGQFPNVANRTISYSCMHCSKPRCIEICPQKAIAKRADDGIVVVDQGKCIGCKSCFKACPFHIPQYGKSGRMQKCDMCLERLSQGKQPACVATCPGEALKFHEIGNLSGRSDSNCGERLSASTNPAFFISGKMTGSVFLAQLKVE